MKRCSVRPYTGRGKYIFVSYCHKDKRYVFPIIEQMARDGYNIWYDEGIDPGSEWPEIIAKHLDECTVCLAIISKNSLNSHNCRREINFALLKKKYFISAVIEQVDLSLGMQLQLSATQSIFKYTLSNDREFFDKLYEAQALKECYSEPDPKVVVSKPEDYDDNNGSGMFSSSESGKGIGEITRFVLASSRSEIRPPKDADEGVKQSDETGEILQKAEKLRLEKERLEAEKEKIRREEEALREAEEEARRKAEEARRKEEERIKAEAEARRIAEEKEKAEEEARRKAEEEARRKEEERLKAEAEAKRKAEEERLKAEAEARRKAEEERLKAEAETRRKAEEEMQRKAEEEIRRRQSITANLVRAKTGEIINIDRDTFILGRSETKASYTILGNSMIGREHAKIVRSNGEHFIVDNNSLNKTHLNSLTLEPEQYYKLSDGDVIRLANEIFSFHLQK